jgi:hypothetical protein
MKGGDARGIELSKVSMGWWTAERAEVLFDHAQELEVKKPVHNVAW